MATIVTKNSSTPSAVPTTSNLVQGELAVNVTDKRLFTENASTQIVELGTNPSTITTTTATVSGTLTANGTFASSNAVVTGGSVNSTPIGATTPSTVRGTTVTATTGFVGDLTGNVVGNVTGNVTGNVVGNVTGDLTGNVTASSGTSTVNNLVVNGTVDFTNTRLTDVAEPVSGSDAATKTYVDTSIAAVIDGAPAALDTLNELAAALNDDASFHTTVTNALTGKLALSGGTMTGQLSLGTNKIVSVGDPTLAQDVATKAYVDAADSTGLPLSGGTMSGAIAMGTNKITGLGTPTDAADATTKSYTDSILGSATSAAASAAAASTSESNAATSASNAASSATASSNSANASASSASEAATSYDNFDDRYLGQKASDPSVDNDGDALLTGALYFNTTSDAMKVYTGAAWVAVAPVATSVTVSQISDYTGTATELNYTDGVTSSIQTQLDAKAPLASPTFTGTVTATAFSGDGSALTGVDSLPIQTGNAGEFLTTDGTNPSWTPLSTSPTLEATASGALANGDMVIVNADGTVSVVTQTLGPSVIGSPTVYNSALSRYNNITYDSSNNKVIIVYRNADSTAYGEAVVGTVSGTSITFGTPVVFLSYAISMEQGAVTYDSSNNKIVIAYRRNTDQYGYAIVGTVSGTSISFGTQQMFLNSLPTDVSTIFDSNSNKVVIFFSNNGSASYGQYVVGTVSGSSISFGSVADFNSANTRELAATFDSFNNKVIVVYRDNGNSERGTARVGNVSGTSISFGSEVIFNSGTSNDMSATFDSSNNKVVISYSDEPDGYKGKCIVGTVSGTSISFGSPVVFESNSAYAQTAITFDSVYNKIIVAWRQDISSVYKSLVAVGTVSGTSISFGTPLTFIDGYTQNPTITYDSNAQAAVIVYMNNTNSNYGTASVVKSVTASSTLTSENFIGVSDAAYSDGETAKIQLVGSVDDAQSGLTAGQTYYVQGNNTLSETPADPSVVAGTAVSATKLIVKG